MIETGFVEKKTRKTPEGNTSNLYVLHLDRDGENSALPSENDSLRVVKNLHHPSENISPTLVKIFHPEPVTLLTSQLTLLLRPKKIRTAARAKNLGLNFPMTI
ncbi:Uncharacterised protein [Avibacterium paragallinarum]|uniref:Uncharacterized protein n=1 Tax=Avibacterium paragallinarum TaxID=728 RepID=A0A380X8V6_AVIPA|nr:Uncharacterised protein [Avibacterium paragallinarum]